MESSLIRERNEEALPYLRRARELFASHGLTADAQDPNKLIEQATSAGPTNA